MSEILSYFVFNKESATHLGYDTHRELRIKQNKYAEFVYAYCTAYKDSIKFPIGEKVPQEPPIIINLEIPYEDIGDELPYSESFLDTLVLNTQNCISELLNSHGLEGDGKHLTCILAVTNPYDMGDFKAITISLNFPLLQMPVSDQKKKLRASLIKIYRKENILFTLMVKCLNSIESTLIHDNLDYYYPMLGSKTNSGDYIRFYDKDSVRLEDSSSLWELMPVRYHMDVNKHSVVIDESLGWDYYLPMIISVRYDTGNVVELTTDDPELIELIDDVKKDKSQEQQIADIMLPLLNLSKRFKQEIYRNKVGMALYNLYDGDDAGFVIWLNYCRKVEEGKLIEEDEYKVLYNNFGEGNYITEITLQSYAKEDSPKHYNQWYITVLNTLIDDAVESRNPGAISRVLCHMYKLEYAFIYTKNGGWYRHNGSYLVNIKLDDPGIEQIRNQIKQRDLDLARGAIGADHGVQRKQETYSKNVLLISKYLDTQSALSGISRFMKLSFTKKSAGVSLNENQQVFPLRRGGVFESTNTGMVHRPGILEDYFTFHSYVSYDSSLTENHPIVIAERKFSMRLHGDADVLNYLDMKRSKELRGRNKEKTLELRLGPPNGGKTTDGHIDKLEFGDLLFSGNTTSITGKRGSSQNATPDTALTNNKRKVNLDDPESGTDVKLNEGWLCQESGGSNRHNRLLNEDGTDSKAAAAYSITANDPPPLRPTQQVKLRTIAIYNTRLNLSKEDADSMGITIPDSPEEQERLGIFPKIIFSDAELKNFATARLWRDFNNHSKIDWSTNIPRPVKIIQYTNRYWMSFCPYHRFVRDHVRKSDINVKLTRQILYDCFVYWYRRSFHSSSVPGINEFRSCIKGIIGDCDDKHEVYKGFRLRDKRFKDFTDTMVVTAEPDYLLSQSVAYSSYKVWASNSYDRIPITDIYTFIAYMSSTVAMHDNKKKGFLGIQILPPNAKQLK